MGYEMYNVTWTVFTNNADEMAIVGEWSNVNVNC